MKRRKLAKMLTRFLIAIPLLLGLGQSCYGQGLSELDFLIKKKKLRAAERLCRKLNSMRVDTGTRLSELHQRLESEGYVKLGLLWIKKKSRAKFPNPKRFARAKVIERSGKVMIKRVGQAKATELKEATFDVGCEIITDKNGKVSLSFDDDAVVTLYPYSGLIVSPNRIATTTYRAPVKAALSGLSSLSLSRGKLTVSVDKTKKAKFAKSPIVIDTPSSILAVRGTAFSVNTEISGTEVRVLNGKVECRSYTQLENPILVSSLKSIQLVEGEASSVRRLTAKETEELRGQVLAMARDGLKFEAETLEFSNGPSKKGPVATRALSSGGQIRLWQKETGLRAGEKASFNFKVKESGTYALSTSFLKARSSGASQILIDGRKIGPVIDHHFSDKAIPKTIQLGQFILKRGVLELTFESLKGKSISLDTLELKLGKKSIRYEFEEFKHSAVNVANPIVALEKNSRRPWTKGSHIQLRGMEKAPRITFMVPVPKSGTYQLVLGTGLSWDSRQFKCFVGKRELAAKLNLPHPMEKFVEEILGTVKLKKGQHVLTIESHGRKAGERDDLFFDYFRLSKP